MGHKTALQNLAMVAEWIDTQAALGPRTHSHITTVFRNLWSKSIALALHEHLGKKGGSLVESL